MIYFMFFTYILVTPKIPPSHKKQARNEIRACLLKHLKPLIYAVFCLFEVSIEKTLKCFAVSSLVASHFVNGVVDGVKT